MPEDEKITNPTPAEEPVEDESAWKEAFIELKKNSVPKKDYEAKQAELKEVLNKVALGEEQFGEEKQEEEHYDAKELRKELYGERTVALSNLDYIDKTLKLRKEEMRNGSQDPFAPQGKNIVATDEDLKKASNLAEVLQECVDEAEGDSAVFTALLQRRTTDVAPLLRKKK